MFPCGFSPSFLLGPFTSGKPQCGNNDKRMVSLFLSLFYAVVVVIVIVVVVVVVVVVGGGVAVHVIVLS